MEPIYGVTRKASSFQWGHDQEDDVEILRQATRLPFPTHPPPFALWVTELSNISVYQLEAVAEDPWHKGSWGTPFGFQTHISRSQLKGKHPLRDIYWPVIGSW